MKVTADRIQAAFKRHGISWLGVSVFATSVVLAAHARPGVPDFAAMRSFPVARMLIAMVGETSSAWWPAAIGLVCLAALFVQIAAYRLTGNRAVAAAAGLVLAAHPLTVRTLGDARGLFDAATLFFAALVFALHAKPRFRSHRFPNKRPSAFVPATAIVLFIAALTVPGAWTFPLFMIVMDLSFDRERGGSPFERRWLTYGPYVLIAGVSCICHAMIAAEKAIGPESIGRRIFDYLLPAADAGAPWIFIAIAVLGMIAGVFLFVVDVIADIGRRRALVRYVGFGSAFAFVVLLPAGLVRSPSLTANGLTGLLGLSVTVGALIWRILIAVRPEAGPIAAPMPAIVQWTDVRDRAEQKPVPALSSTPVVRPISTAGAVEVRTPVPERFDRTGMIETAVGAPILLSPALQKALAHLGRTMAAHERLAPGESGERKGPASLAPGDRSPFVLDPFVEKEILSLVPIGAHVLEVTPSGSGYTPALAAKARRFSVLATSSTDPAFLRAELEAVAGAHVVRWCAGTALPSATKDVDFVFTTSSLRYWPNVAIAVFFRELRRVLRPGARGAVGFGVLAFDAPIPTHDARPDAASIENLLAPDMVRTLVAGAGLELEALHLRPETESFAVVRRPIGDE